MAKIPPCFENAKSCVFSGLPNEIGAGTTELQIFRNMLGSIVPRFLPTTLNAKGQVTIPKRIRDALGLKPGMQVEFAINRDGQVVIRRADQAQEGKADRFGAARGRAEIKWRTDSLMALLRGEA
jgi:antitoxin PrlF